MAGLIPQDFINELLQRVDIVELIGARLELKKKGKSYVGLCPFHTEKTGSFNVVPDKQFYHCFGCGASGTALTFLLEHDRLEFVESVEMLASLVGMEVPREAAGSARKRVDRSLYDVLEAATRFFRASLREAPQAIDYLKRRGLTGEVARDFGIGYAPEGWDRLRKALADVPIDRLQAAGLLSQNDSGRTYDRFRDRIMFPIRDTRGRTIAFGGRVLEGDGPKYLNSPETELFHKSDELYGLFEARRAVRQIDRFVLVEGYMDVVALVQAGLPTVVASLGTAATDSHFRKLYRFSSEVVCCFDGDRAGRAAAWKALDNALPALSDGRSLKFLFLPDGEDPDSLVRSEGRQAFEARLTNAMPLSDYFFSELGSGIDLDSLEGRARLAQLARPYLDKLPEGVLKALLFDRLGGLVQLRPDQLAASAQAQPIRAPVRSENSQKSADQALKKRLLSSLLKKPDGLGRLPESIQAGIRADLAKPEDKGLFAEVMRFLLDKPDAESADLLGHFMGEPGYAQLTALAEVASSVGPASIDAEIADGIARLLANRQRDERTRLLGQMREGGSSEASTEALSAYLEKRRSKPS